MKYSAVVLFHPYNSVTAVDYVPVTDALLAGGVFLDEIVFRPYDADFGETVSRLSLSCDGVFVIAEGALLSSARQAAATAAEREFTEEYLLEAGRTLFAVLPAGERGAEAVRCEVMPRVDERRRNNYLRVVLGASTAPADKLQTAVAKAREAAGDKLIVHAREKYGVCRIELIYDRATPKMVADEVARILAVELADYLFTLEDKTIAERLVEALRLRRMRISTAESFTGGGVGRAIVRVPGASEVFFEGLNTYDEHAKMKRLGVKEETLSAKGAVSADTAYEMATGLIRTGDCDLAVATTGAAGPTSPQEGVPVGLVYIAVGTREQVNVFRFRIGGNRETITETAINYALFLAYREVK